MSEKIFKTIASMTAVITLLLSTVYSAYMFWEKAPDIQASSIPSPDPSPIPAAVSPSPTENIGVPFNTDRHDGVYTLLLVGNDDGNGNTDTIMVGKIDTKNHIIDFVSIPRDTIINENWNIRKINAVYWSDVNSGGNGIDALRDQLRSLMGFDIDCYAVIDLSVFVDVVDAMGGVYFDVPQAMDYEDGWQNLYIHLEPGYQLLDGYNAMGLCRYRSGYIEGDIGRINMQHEFLKACASQFIDLGKIPNISEVLTILAECIDTNMSAANIAFFVRQALQCPKENISFYTAPTTPEIIHGYSYAVLDLQPWVEMINSYLNPYETDVSSENLDLVYKEGSSFRSTNYLRGSEYYLPVYEPINQVAENQSPEPEPPSEPEFNIPDAVLPIPDNPQPTETIVPEIEIPDSIGNIIIDY